MSPIYTNVAGRVLINSHVKCHYRFERPVEQGPIEDSEGEGSGEGGGGVG